MPHLFLVNRLLQPKHVKTLPDGSGLFRISAKDWISTYMIDTIKKYTREQKNISLNKIHKYYDATSAVVSTANSSVCDDD